MRPRKGVERFRFYGCVTFNDEAIGAELSRSQPSSQGVREPGGEQGS